MSSSTFSVELRELYDGELLGEAFFETLMTIFTLEPQAYKLAIALQLETETKARLRPHLINAGLCLNDNGSARKSGYELADAFRGLTWETAMRKLIEILDPALERYREIAASAPAEYQDLASSMLVHEESLLVFAQLELKEDGHDSVQAMNSQLRFSISTPEGL